MPTFEELVEVLVESMVPPTVTEFDVFTFNTPDGITDIRNAVAFGGSVFNNNLMRVNHTNPADSKPYIMCGFSIEGCIVSGERPFSEPSNFHEHMGFALRNQTTTLPVIVVP